MSVRTAVALFAALVLALPLNAAVIEEVVVTAQKREQNVQDVGIAISAVTGEQMRQLGYTNAQQVTALAPGVHTVQPNGEANYAIAMRGVAANDFTTNVESPVAIYLDEVYISQMSGSGFMLFDMERVELLRGPQGTLYGRNATGGLAHFVTVRPAQETDGYAQLTLGSYDQVKFEGAVGGGLAEGVSARVSVATHDNNGYIENRFLDERLNNANEWAGRVQVLFEPSDSFDVLLNYRRSEQDIDTGFFEHVSANVSGMLTPNEVNQVLGYIDNDGDVYEGDYDRDGHNDLVTEGFTATVNWAFDRFTLTSITDYSTVKRDYIEDSDASPVPLFNFFLTTDAEQFSQEVRLNGSTDTLDWVAGVYYLDLSVDDSNGAETDPFIDPAGDTPDITGLDNPYETNTESWSIFGQIERRLGDNLTGILGARWIRDEKDHAYVVNVVDFIPGTVQRNGNPNILVQLANYSGEREDDEFSVRAALNYDLNEDVMIYGSWNRGVKGGGYNSPVFPLNPPLGYDDATMSYDPEQLDAFEVGFKSRLAGGLAIFNGAAYYYDYKDYQAFQIIGLDTITINANADSYGFELELQATPTDGLDVILGLAYNDIEVSLGDGPKTTSVQSPKWNLNGLVRYAWPLAGGELAAQFDALYRSKHYFSLTGLETVEEDGYTIANASLSYTSGNGGFTVTGFVHNLGDVQHLVQTFDLSGPDVFGMVEQYYNKPRWWGVSLAMNF
ncbi:MAG: TonB-dependent receptor [Gammaproteobacteria bacterium]|nr:TonB-dependent receptor [Gammaproteobacteria bacterium]